MNKHNILIANVIVGIVLAISGVYTYPTVKAQTSDFQTGYRTNNDIETCFNESSTSLMNQYTNEQKEIMSENFTTLAQSLGKPSLNDFNGNHTFIQALQIALKECLTNHKTTTTSTTSKNLNQSVNNTKTFLVSAIAQAKSDGSVGVRDTGSACSSLNGTELNQCVKAYDTEFNKVCLGSRFGCNG